MLTEFSSNDVRKFMDDYEAIIKQCVTYVNLKYNVTLYASSVVVEYWDASTFVLVDLDTYTSSVVVGTEYYDPDDGVKYKVPFGIFDSWANTITDLQHAKSIVAKDIADNLEVKERAEYERLKQKFG